MQRKHVETLVEFTTSFFTVLGAKVKALSRRKHSPLEITLTGEMAQYFETDSLILAFQQAEPVQGQQLVAHGSPIFDKMLAYLDRKSAVALQHLPARHSAGEALLQAVRPTNAGIVNLRTTQTLQPLFVFYWRITYRADDKREEIYTVILDEAGERVLNQAAANNDPQDTPNTPPAFDVDTLLADAEPPPPETDEDGQPIPPKLPPMTHLVRLAETARKYTVYHADVRCVSHEAEILPRLYKTLNRLSTYYQQQIEEVYEAHDPNGEKRRALELDLERKLAEEVENHRLRVQLQLVNYAVLQMPVAVAQMTLSDGVREVALTVEQNRYNGTLHRPACHACGKEVTSVAIDRNSHLTCDDCVQQCGTCQDILCADCGVEPCPACGTLNCDTCGQLCWACGERACAEHISTCPTCGDAVCHACQSACGACGVRQCRSHLRIDHVSTTQGETVLVCAGCAIRCPGCEQYSAQIGTCATSGQRFCRGCLIDCTKCGKTVGPGFYETFNEQPYCLSCLEECPSCHSWALKTIACPVCGIGYCAACEQRCAICETSHCSEHSHYFGSCDHTLCHNHVVYCNTCQEPLCSLCNDSCAICEGHHCATHAARCERCSQTYCQACVRTTGLCSTCAGLDLDLEENDPAQLAIDLTNEPCATDPRVVALAAHYQWSRAINHRYKIYWGQNSLGRTALIVTRYATALDTDGDDRTASEIGEEEIVAIRGRGAAGSRKQAEPKAQADQRNLEEKDPNAWMNEFQDWLRRMRRRRGR